MIWPDPVSPLSPLDFLRQPEVGHSRVAALVEQDVGRLHVAVNHAALVGILDRLGTFTISAAASRGGMGRRPRVGRGSGPRRSPCEK